MTNTGERLIKSAKQAAAMAKCGQPKCRGAELVSHTSRKRHGLDTWACPSCGLSYGVDAQETSRPPKGQAMTHEAESSPTVDALLSDEELHDRRNYKTRNIDPDYWGMTRYEIIEAQQERIQELEAEVERLRPRGAERYWEGRWRDLNAELSGVHAGTHCIVPFSFIELAADPV